MTKDAANCKDTERLIETGCGETPLIELARHVPKDLRAEWETQWFDDGTPCGHAMAPVGKYLHDMADALEAMQKEKAELIKADDAYIEELTERIAELEGLLRTLRYLPINRDRDTLEGYAGAVREITRQGLGMPALKGDNDE